MPKPTILILTAHVGGGHLNLSQALRDALSPRYNVVIMDPQPGMVNQGYAVMSRSFVKFLEWQFVLTDIPLVAAGVQYGWALMNRKRFMRVIEEVQPDLIIATHAFLSYAAARANERSARRVPLVFQLTDLGRLNLTWFVEKHADAYLAPTREIFAQSLRQGIEKDRLHLTGRPIRRQFLEADLNRREETLSELGFDPVIFTVFLQGGAKGSAGVDHTVESLLTAGVPVQIILAVGNNEAMAARYAGAERVRTLPFTEAIAPYMAAADVIVGKAGASFISEAFMLEKPFLVTKFIPGQETPNLGFIEQHNLGWICLEASAQKELLATIASNPDLIAEKVSSIRTYKAWNNRANREIGPIIDQLLSRKREDIPISGVGV